MHFHSKGKYYILVLTDVFALLSAYVLSFLLLHKISIVSQYKPGIIVLTLSIMTVFIIMDIYSLQKLARGCVRQIFWAGSGLVIGAVIATFIFFFFRALPMPRSIFITFFPVALLLLSATHYLFTNTSGLFTVRKLLFVGKKSAVTRVSSYFSRRKDLHCSVVGYISDEPEAESTPDLIFLGNTETLTDIAMRENIDQIIVVSTHIDQHLMRPLLECMQRKIRVLDFKKVIEGITGKVPIDYLSDNWFIIDLGSINKKYFFRFKRGIDILSSLLGLCIFFPLLPLLALLIKLDSKGPVFYSQLRVGRGGKRFAVLKLRTMHNGADKENMYWTMKNDNRITRAGSFLRKVRLDELPQFINILKGDMSLIGPRPEAESLSELYTKEIPYYAHRHMVTPGITGWAQVKYGYGNSVKDAREKLTYDFYYIKYRSPVLDMLIFLNTIRIVLTGRGAL